MDGWGLVWFICIMGMEGKWRCWRAIKLVDGGEAKGRDQVRCLIDLTIWRLVGQKIKGDTKSGLAHQRVDQSFS